MLRSILVNEAGVVVAGAFTLVRFRSAPGSAKESITIFLAMGTGFIAGMGYLGFTTVGEDSVYPITVLSGKEVAIKAQKDTKTLINGE